MSPTVAWAGQDGDGTPDSLDACPTVPGPEGFNGCPGGLFEVQPTSRADFNGDGKADYCRRVGTFNQLSSYVQCTLGAAGGFGTTVSSLVLDWGQDVGRAWVDFSGDGKADFCRLIGVANGDGTNKLQCTMSTGGGLGATVTSGEQDWGGTTGRAWVDTNGDGRADFCRRVHWGEERVSCTLSTGTGFGATVTSDELAWGQDIGRGWVDFNGDGKADFCRLVGIANWDASRLRCTLGTGSGFSGTVTSGVLDWGGETGREWVDFNGDGKADFCRRVAWGANQVQCTLSTGSGFGATVTSGGLDWGQDIGRAWVNVNGDNKADFCRLVGIANWNASKLQCTLSTGTGFGATVTSGVLDWGGTTGRGWVDADGDNKVDFCRRVAWGANQVQCTMSTGSGFGATVTSGQLDWGHVPGQAWVGL